MGSFNYILVLGLILLFKEPFNRPVSCEMLPTVSRYPTVQSRIWWYSLLTTAIMCVYVLYVGRDSLQPGGDHKNTGSKNTDRECEWFLNGINGFYSEHSHGACTHWPMQEVRRNCVGHVDEYDVELVSSPAECIAQCLKVSHASMANILSLDGPADGGSDNMLQCWCAFNNDIELSNQFTAENCVDPDPGDRGWDRLVGQRCYRSCRLQTVRRCASSYTSTYMHAHYMCYSCTGIQIVL